MPGLPSRNETLAVAVKKHAKVDIKLFFSCTVLLDFSLVKYLSGIVDVKYFEFFFYSNQCNIPYSGLYVFSWKLNFRNSQKIRQY